MYVIMVYDVNEARVVKVLKIGRRYLTRVQNSVFEGELTWAQLEKMKSEVQEVIEPSEDSVLFYILRDEKWVQRQRLGKSKGEAQWVV